MKLYSYVVQHDEGHAPNPFHGFCTLAHCKYSHSDRKNVIESVVAQMQGGEECWVVGTGGANPAKSTGHGTIVYVMHVDEFLTLSEYYDDKRFSKKKRKEIGTYVQRMGDNYYKNQSDGARRYVLISWTYYYFGRNAISIPKRFRDRPIEKQGPAFRHDFDDEFIKDFVSWLEMRHDVGRHGNPSMAHKKIGGC